MKGWYSRHPKSPLSASDLRSIFKRQLSFAIIIVTVIYITLSLLLKASYKIKSAFLCLFRLFLPLPSFPEIRLLDSTALMLMRMLSSTIVITFQTEVKKRKDVEADLRKSSALSTLLTELSTVHSPRIEVTRIEFFPLGKELCAPCALF